MVSSGNGILTILILTLVAVSIGSAVHAENTSFLTYNDTQEGFSILYPEGASLLYAADADMSEVSVLTPENITMIRISVSNTGETLENLTSSMLSSTTFIPDFSIKGSGKDTLGGADAFYVDYQWTRDDAPIRSYVLTTVNDGKQYSISYDNSPDRFEEEKGIIDQLYDSFTFIPRESKEKYYPGYSYYPGTVYDYFGMPMTDYGSYTWNPYENYGWDGSTGYSYPSTNYNQFPSYTGYDPYSQGYQQYQQQTLMPTMMPTLIPTMGYTMPTSMQTAIPTLKPYQTVQQGSYEDLDQLVSDGFDYLTKNQYKQAEAKFKAAMQMDPSDFRSHFGYGKVLYLGYEDREDEALEEIDLALSAAGQTASDLQKGLIYDMKAEIERFLNKYDDALESVNSAIYQFSIADSDSVFPAGSYYTKARILYSDNAPWAEVIEAAEKAVSLDSTNEKYSDFLEMVKKESNSGSSGGSVYPSVTPVQTSEEDNTS